MRSPHAGRARTEPPARGAAPRRAVVALCRVPGRALGRVLAGATIAAAAAAAAAQATEAPPAAAGCTVVFGQGRNASGDDAAANDAWDQVNLAFNHGVAERLRGAQPAAPVVALVLKVTATERAANAERLLAQAVAERCDRIVETTVFADYEQQALVARLRLHPLQRAPGASSAAGGPGAPGMGGAPAAAAVAGWQIAAPAFVSERRFPLSRAALDRIRPARLAQEMGDELLAALAPPAAAAAGAPSGPPPPEPAASAGR